MNSSALLDALKGCGAELAAGLTDSQLDRAQERFGFLFAPDHRLMLLRDGRHYYGSDLLDWFEHERVTAPDRTGLYYFHVETESGRRFSFRVSSAGIPVADWSYEFEPTVGGCRVTESWVEQRPGWFKPIARVATGVADRSVTNRAGMEQTLERLAAVAEASG